MTRPVELYRFVQDGEVYTYTSADRDETHNAETYVSTPMGRNNINIRNELAKANIDVSFPVTHPQAFEWMKGYTEAPLGLTVFQKTASSTDVIWKGRLASVKPGDAMIVLVFESVFTSMRRPGLRARFQRPCRHVLYRPGCNLNKDDFGVPITVTASAGVLLTVPDAAVAPAGDFFLGMIAVADTLRFVVAHAGEVITIARPIPGLSALLPLEGILYPGCDRSKGRCQGRFANNPNYGGFRWIPIRNPMDGSSIT